MPTHATMMEPATSSAERAAEPLGASPDAQVFPGTTSPGSSLGVAALAALVGTISTIGFVASLVAVDAAAGFLALAAATTAAWPRPTDAASPPAVATVWGLGACWAALAAGLNLDPIVEAGWRCGTGDIALVILGAPVVFVTSVVAFLVARKVAGPTAARPAVRWWHPSRWWLGAVGLAGLALVVGSAERRLSHPGPDGYVESLPIVARIPAPSTFPCVPTTQPSGATVCATTVHDAWPLRAEYECPTEPQQSCRLDVLLASGDPPVARPTDVFVPRDEALVVRRDSSEGLYVIESHGNARRAVRDSGELVFFLRPSDVGHALGAPAGWIGLGAGGLALAALLTSLARWRERTAARLATSRGGVLGANGWVELADGSPPVLAAPERWSGPVTVLGGPVAAGYRSARSALRVLRGAPSELADREHAWARSARVAAIAVLALGLAPLLAALRLGIAL